MSMKKIATLANVSVPTVSKSFSGSSEVSEETRKAVFDAAKELGLYDKYTRNKFKKKVIGVICPDIESDLHRMVVTHLRKELEKLNAIMALSITGFSKSAETEVYNYYSSYLKADGIIIIGAFEEISSPYNPPTVYLMNKGVISGKKSDVIQTTSYISMEKAITHLRANGHKSIAYISNFADDGRYDMFSGAMKKQGYMINKDLVRISEKPFEEAGKHEMDTIFENGTKPDAVIVANDNIAVGVYKSIHGHGLKIPDDISVIGMDNTGISSFLEPPLSTISLITEEHCRMAAELVMKRIKSRFYRTGIIKLPSEFIIRKSTGVKKW